MFLKKNSNEPELKLETDIEDLETNGFLGSIEKLYDTKQDLQNIRENFQSEKLSKYLTSIENKNYLEKRIKHLEYIFGIS